MPFRIIRDDIANMQVDAVVNAANAQLLPGGGVCGSLFHGAGLEEMARACQELDGCAVGDAVVTPGFALPARYVIHAAGPVWQGGQANEAQLLRSCYDRAFAQAVQLGAESLAFPLISSGAYGYPKAAALSIALEAVSAFLETHDMALYLVVFDKEAVKISQTLFNSVQQFIDDTYEGDYDYGGTSVLLAAEEAGLPAEEPRFRIRKHRSQAAPQLGQPCAPPPRPCQAARGIGKGSQQATRKAKQSPAQPAPQSCQSANGYDDVPQASSMSISQTAQLENLVAQLDESFSESLLRLIDQQGLTDVEVYKRANISRKLFSKIRSNSQYRPSKPTVLALAIALRLPLDQTKGLMEKAGFALSHASKFDVIVEYFIINQQYDLFTINETLFAFDQMLLGS